MQYLFTMFGLLLFLLIGVPCAFIVGFIMQLLLNPILTYFGIKALSTTLCACIVGLIWLIRALF